MSESAKGAREHRMPRTRTAALVVFVFLFASFAPHQESTVRARAVSAGDGLQIDLGAWWLGPPGTSAEAEPKTPRILLVGDSWAGFMWGFHSFSAVLPDYGLGQYEEKGLRTAIMGAKADDYISTNRLQALTEELTAYPTLDIVHVLLGGNDLLFGNSQYGRWRPYLTPEEEAERFAYVADCIATVVDHALAVRPDIKVALCGYDYANHTISGSTIEQANLALTRMERLKLEIADETERCFYIHNFGLMEHHYGIPGVYRPGDVPRPAGPPDYEPYPNGDPSYAPHPDALLDNDIHLSEGGYAYVARNAMDQFYAEWLSLPRVLSIDYVGTADGNPQEILFEVTFSQAVSGVDATDFALTPIEAKAATIAAVTGAGVVYTVHVSLAGDPGTLRLDVLDDDSIVDAALVPLGGAGLGNGPFTGGETYPPTGAEGEGEGEHYCGSVDFDPIMMDLDAAIRPYLGGISLGFHPAICDLNGGLIYIIPTPNGMLDRAEFEIIMAALNDPDLDLSATGGLTHSEMCDAWTTNVEVMDVALDGPNTLVSNLLPGLQYLLAAYLTLGDSDSVVLPTALLLAAAEEAPYLGLHSFSMGDCTLLPHYLACAGDADGDGYTNQEEYGHFTDGQPDYADYVIAALNPDLYPGSGTGAADLAVDPHALTLTHDGPAAIFEVVNLGLLTLRWTAESDTESVTIDRASGTGARTITVTAVNFDEDLSANITVTNDGDPADAETVVVEVVQPLPADLDVSVHELALAEPSPSATFDIINLGERPLPWTVRSNTDALTVSPRAGTNHATVTVIAADFTSDVTAEVAATNADDPADTETVVVQIEHTAAPADLAVSRNLLTLSQASPSGTFDVLNLGERPLHWTAGSDTASVTVAPEGGTGDATVAVTAADFSADLTACAAVTNTDDPADAETIVVEVVRTPSPPDLDVSLNLLTLSEAAPSGTFTIANLGELPLEWIAHSDTAGVAVEPGAGTDDATVTVTATDFTKDLTAHVTVTNAADPSDGATVVVEVIASVRPSGGGCFAGALAGRPAPPWRPGDVLVWAVALAGLGLLGRRTASVDRRHA